MLIIENGSFLRKISLICLAHGGQNACGEKKA